MDRKMYKVRWADVDMNGHLRHSAYADFCAQARVEVLAELGLGLAEMRELAIGLILFKEEIIYKREVVLNEILSIETQLVSARKDASRWSIKHLMNKADGVLACVVNVDGAWMDLHKRKLAALPSLLAAKMLAIPKIDSFIWAD